MSREITNSDIKKKGSKFHAVADWRDDNNESGTERETFDTFDEASAWLAELESDSDTGTESSPANSDTAESDNTNSNDDEKPAHSDQYKPATPLPGEDVTNRGDMSHSPSAEGFTPNAVPTATDKDTIPEPAASDMNPADAENINSNVIPPTPPAGAEQGSAGVDPFSNPLTDGQTAADTQPAPSDHNNSNEVSGVQDPNATPSNSSQQSETESSTDDGTDQSDTRQQ